MRWTPGQSQRRGLAWLSIAGRAGLVARTAFYLVLAGITVDVAVQRGGARQADGHGALALIAATGIGVVLIGAAAAGFVLLGLTRIAAAARGSEDRTWSRVGAALQGLMFFVIAAVPVEFLAGQGSAGSKQSEQHTASTLLGFSGGRIVVLLAAVVLVVVCCVQIWRAAHEDFLDSLDLPAGRPWVRRLAAWSGRSGLIARSLVYLPISGFLVAAAIDDNPRQASGLDGELATAARQPWGPYVLALVAVGLLLFAVYSGIESAYKDLTGDC